MKDAILQLAFAGIDRRRFVDAAVASGLLPDGAPATLRLDAAAAKGGPPLGEALAKHDDVVATWGGGVRLQANHPHDRLLLTREPWHVTIEGTLALVRDLPFEACTTQSLDPEWWEGYDGSHGWAFLLKGAGHRLVSPRVIDRGPWRRVRDEAAGVTLFQFHDLDADADTALAQARPGHALLDFMWRGGHYAGTEAAFKSGARGVRYEPSFYDKKTRTSIVLVQEREVSQREIGVAAGTKIHQVFPEPVEQVAYVFMDEAAARRHLPILWLYGLEVRAMTGAGERRIDEDYAPPPPPAPPEWVSAAPRT